MPHTTLVWFRQDLRLADHPALTHAVDRSDAVVPVFIWAPEEAGGWPPGGAHRWWLHRSLQALDRSLRDKGSRLMLRHGPSLETLRTLIEETGAGAVCWHTGYEPALRERDARIRDALREDGTEVRTFEGRLLHDVDGVRTGSGGPYQVYTPFWRKLGGLDLPVEAPLPVPRMGETKAPAAWPDSLPVEAFGLTPVAQDGVDWAGGFDGTPGEAAAHERLQAFIDHSLIDYPDRRNRPDVDGSSRLSPHLHHGELSPRQVWHAVQDWIRNRPMKDAAEVFLKEIVWREFAYHLLHHFPHTPAEPLKDTFAAFPWEDDADGLDRWQRGQTGYPIVDAGMRQLWQTGWMHNRVRMIVASFLTKDLLIPWQRGAEWFWDTLVDGDLASNTMGWQWAAGCGADAQPFFRIFNPVSQGERYDPDGAYVRRWVPELADLPTNYIHQPWTAPHDVLRRAGVELGTTYPRPIVDHGQARDRALAAYETVRQRSKGEA